MASSSEPAFEAFAPVLLNAVEDGFWRGPVRVAAVLQLDGRIEADAFRLALRHLQGRHPKLRAVVTRAPRGRSRYEHNPAAPPIPFEIVDVAPGGAPWRAAVSRLLQAGGPTEAPLAAATVLREAGHRRCWLILCVHHGIADGRSGIVLLHDLLMAYAAAESTGAAPLPPALPLLSTARAASKGTWLDRIRVLRRYVRLQREEKHLRHTPLPLQAGIPPQSQWVHWIFTREDTLHLIRLSRKEQASLTGALGAAVFGALLECLSLPEALFKWHCPFDVRESLRTPTGRVTSHDLGSFASLMRGRYRVSQPMALWDLARRMHRDVQAFAQQGGPEFGFNMARVVTSRTFARAEPVLLPSSGKRPTLFFTNYGVLDINDAYGSLRPRGCTLNFNGDDDSGPLLTMEVLVMGQQLNVGFASAGLDPSFWERLVEAVGRHLTVGCGLRENVALTA